MKTLLTLLALLSLLSLLPLTPAAAIFTWGPFRVKPSSGLNCRSGPGTSHGVVIAIPYGTRVYMGCQRSGTRVEGNNVWDYVLYRGKSCYVADAHLSTGHAGRYPGVLTCGTHGLPGRRGVEVGLDGREVDLDVREIDLDAREVWDGVERAVPGDADVA